MKAFAGKIVLCIRCLTSILACLINCVLALRDHYHIAYVYTSEQFSCKCLHSETNYISLLQSYRLLDYLSSYYEDFWLGAKGDGTTFKWNSGKILSSSSPYWHKGHPSARLDGCLTNFVSSAPYYSQLCGVSIYYAICQYNYNGCSAWSPWSMCSSNCQQQRSRTCSNSSGSKYCPGPGALTMSQACTSGKCKVDGGWSIWTSWSLCSSDCTQHRSRSCKSPRPKGIGRDCPGDHVISQYCTDGMCKCNTHRTGYFLVKQQLLPDIVGRAGRTDAC
ncbi:unnamed protein product, partial [Meganyctiphanes norvegica]